VQHHPECSRRDDTGCGCVYGLMATALRAALAEHVAEPPPARQVPFTGRSWYCRGDGFAAPCPTVRAIHTALIGGEG
jgi:hypothetical protein